MFQFCAIGQCGGGRVLERVRCQFDPYTRLPLSAGRIEVQAVAFLWMEWFTSLDTKKIAIMYVLIAFVILFRAVIEGVLMRPQQAVAVNSPGFVSPEHFAQLFSTHCNIMVFFLAMPFAALLMASLLVGKFSTGGWTGYPPYTELGFSPGVGPDYWI